VRKNVLLLAALTAFAAGQVACGVIEAPMTLALEEGSSMQISLNPTSPNPLVLGTVDLEGGVETLMTAEFSLFAILFHQPVFGVIEVNDLLFAGTPFSLLGIPTGEVCTVQDPNVSSGGTVLIDIFDHQINNASIQFVVDLAAVIRLGNPTLANLIPDGFPLVLSVDADADLTLAEMLALISGDAEGGLAITQELDEVLIADLLGTPLEIGVQGELTLATVNEFPTGPLLDDCIALLGL
jgi:hypothetical protein